MTYQIAASLLSADFARLADDVGAMCQAGVDSIHFDVMDHHYVPNLTVGAMACAALRKAGITTPIDVHLMVTDPAAYVTPFAEAGANHVSFHPETVTDVMAQVHAIKAAGMTAGVVFNPDQVVEISDALLAELDMVLLMSVYPGFGGQDFIPETLATIRQVRARLTAAQSTARLAVDGGVKVDNIASVAAAGADFFVMGSGLFSAHDYTERLRAVHNSLI